MNPTLAQQTSPPSGENAALEEVLRLRAEVADLKEKLVSIHSQSDVEFTPEKEHAWLRIAATIAVTFALGQLIRALKLPTATAVAIPMISNEVNRRFL